MNIPDLTPEIFFQTSRSGGKGGQNVNKVETAVTGFFHLERSKLLADDQKNILQEKLSNRINSEGFLFVKSQQYRTQLENKTEATRKIHEIISRALQKRKKRIATKSTAASREKRLEGKKKKSDKKSGRKKIDFRNP